MRPIAMNWLALSGTSACSTYSKATGLPSMHGGLELDGTVFSPARGHLLDICWCIDAGNVHGLGHWLGMRCATGLSWSRPSTRCAAGVLVLAEWDRATGSLMESISLVERVHKRGADLTTPSRRCILALLSGPAQAERTHILRRAPTRAASPPSSAGSGFGRKPKLDDQQQQDASNGSKPARAAGQFPGLTGLPCNYRKAGRLEPGPPRARRA
jgi:hypothetical protein